MLKIEGLKLAPGESEALLYERAAAEGVDPSRVRDSIRRGLKQLAKYF